MVGFESPFPESPRVLYSPNPIELAICQFRFPQILAIDASPPAEFQELIRQTFPIYVERQAHVFQGAPPEMQALLPPEARLRAHDFSTPDGNSTLTLTNQFLALQTSSYERWEQFRAMATGPLKALETVYSPSFLSRIGLRYQDVIRPRSLSLEGSNWASLLNPSIAAELTDPHVSKNMVERRTSMLIRLNSQDGHVRVSHGLLADDNHGECYLIDSDFYAEGQIPLADGIHRMDSLKRHAGRFFRWCLTDALANAMHPTPIEDFAG